MAEEGFKRKLTAILSADVEGYSRLMGDDEEATVRTLTSYREVLSTLIQQHNGNVLDSPGDNLMAEFVSVVDAVQCAVAVQKEIYTRNEELPENRKMQFRIGINLGDVIQEEGRIYGDGVNIAARLESLAEPGGICISKTAFDHIESKLPYGYDFIGEQTVKNIAKPVGAYRVLLDPRVTVSGKPARSTKSKRVPIFAGAAVVLVLAIAVGIWQFYERRPTEEPASLDKMAFPLPEKPSIAVLPFDNIGGDPEQEYFGDGLAENIIIQLSRIHSLFVISYDSSSSFKGKDVKIQQISQELGVRYVLEGSVQRSGEQLRITAQLIDAVTGRNLWAEKYDRKLKDLFAIQDEITNKVVMELAGKLTEGEMSRLEYQMTQNVEAFNYWIKARGLFRHFNKEDNFKARQLAEKAVELDPEFSAAYSLLGWIYAMSAENGWGENSAQDLKKVEKLLIRAEEVDTSNANFDKYNLRGYLYLIKREYDQAIEQGRLSIKQGPSIADSHALLANSLLAAGQPEESIVEMKNAMRLAPFYPSWFLSCIGQAYLLTERYEEAKVAFKEYIERPYSSTGGHVWLAITYSAMGKKDQAKAKVEIVLKDKPTFSLEEWGGYYRQIYKDAEVVDRFLELARKAGLPDHPPLKLPDKPSIAVLPFVNMSGDQEQEYFSDGISEEIITALSKTPKLFVIARTSSFKYKGKEVDIRTVGRELGVRYVLEGSVRKAGDKVRITAQLIDATTEKHLWAERYDRNLKEIFAIQDEITLAITKAMQVELTKGEMADLTGRGTKNLDAYLKALQAQEQWWRMDKQGTLKAKQLALEAIAIDGQYGYPYAILSWSHMMDVWLQSSESPKESMRLAAEAIQKALTLDESDYRIHIVLSNLYVMQGKHDEAISSAQRALELCPGGSVAHAALGTALRYACRFSEAVQFREQAIKLDPYPTALDYRNLALAYSKVGRYEDAIAEYKKALQANLNDWGTYFGLVEAYTRLNRKAEARNAAEKLLRVRPDFSLNWLAETSGQMYAKKCRSKVIDDLEFLRKADVGLQ